MATSRTTARREWTKQDVKELKTLARQKTPARVIGRKPKRSDGAVRQKAFALGPAIHSEKGTTARREDMARSPLDGACRLFQDKLAAGPAARACGSVRLRRARRAPGPIGSLSQFGPADGVEGRTLAQNPRRRAGE